MATEKVTALSFTRTPEEEITCTPEELRLLQAYRAADDAGKRRLVRLFTAGARGLLPPAGELTTPEEVNRFLDSLTEPLQ